MEKTNGETKMQLFEVGGIMGLDEMARASTLLDIVEGAAFDAVRYADKIQIIIYALEHIQQRGCSLSDTRRDLDLVLGLLGRVEMEVREISYPLHRASKKLSRPTESEAA